MGEPFQAFQVERLLLAAMHACNFHGDNEQQREQMRREVLSTPPGLQADLLDYFRKTYGGVE